MYIYWFIIKDMIKDTDEQPDGDMRYVRQSPEGFQVQEFGVMLLSWYLDVFTNPDALQDL